VPEADSQQGEYFILSLLPVLTIAALKRGWYPASHAGAKSVSSKTGMSGRVPTDDTRSITPARSVGVLPIPPVRFGWCRLIVLSMSNVEYLFATSFYVADRVARKQGWLPRGRAEWHKPDGTIVCLNLARGVTGRRSGEHQHPRRLLPAALFGSPVSQAPQLSWGTNAIIIVPGKGREPRNGRFPCVSS
jgi:hypothetical protein